MADSELIALSALSPVLATDILYVVSDPAGTPSDKKLLISVLFTSPVFITPTLGAALATSVNGLTLTSSTGVITLTNGKTLAVTNTLTLSGTDSTVMTFPSTSATVARTDAGQTFTGVNTFTSPKIITDISDTNGNELIKFTATGSAVNEITIANAATGAGPTISATGGDTNIGIRHNSKGTGTHLFTEQASGSEVIRVNMAVGSASGAYGIIVYNSNGTTYASLDAAGRVVQGTTSSTTINSPGNISLIGDSSVISLGSSAGGVNAAIYWSQPAFTGSTGSSPGTRAFAFQTVNSMEFGAGGSDNLRMVLDSALYIGNGKTRTSPSSITIQGTGGSGSNISGAALKLAGGFATGAGTPGSIALQVAGNTASASVLNVVAHSHNIEFAISRLNDTIKLLTSTTAEQDASQYSTVWTDATHATRTADVVISATLAAAALAEKFRIRADGFYKPSSGNKTVGTQVDATTNTTLANITALSETLTAGRTYGFEYYLYVDADVVGGSKFAVAGTATATLIKYQVQLVDNNTNATTINSRQTALAGAIGQAGTTNGLAIITGSIVVNAAGTLVPQFAQNASAGTSSVLTASTGKVWEI